MLGATGFGGPVALVSYMHRDLVEKKNWISEEEYKEGLALAQLAPGPLAAQLCIYLGFVHHGAVGATLAGIAFIIPSFIMVVLLGVLYQLYGGMTWIQSVFYGVGAAVIGIISISSYKLTTKSIGKFDIQSIRNNWLLWLIFIFTTIVTFITHQENFFIFIGTGFLYMVIEAPPLWIKKQTNTFILLLPAIGFWKFEWSILEHIALFFTKAGAFVFGSGLAIVPFLHGGVVTEYHWLTERQFLDAVAVAMITPGPVVITVGFIGYLVAGFPGACVAALATFFPCYIITIISAPHFKRIAQNISIKAFVNGITAAVIGALVGAVLTIAFKNIVDVPTLLIAVTTISVLLYIKKIQELHIILIAAIIGLILKGGL